MKILAIEKKMSGIADRDCEPFLNAEARRVWELYQQDIVRETYFQRDWHGAVLMLECDSVEQAWELIHTLPLVQKKLVDFDMIPLRAYPGFARLFAAVE